MSLIASFIRHNTSKLVPKLSQSAPNFHSLVTREAAPLNPGGLFNILSRSAIRVHFPRPSERKRVQRHGWKTRMSTADGRRTLMNRILKGRWVISH
ncbi:hypothetical protein HUJ04_001209 [Dendroctonus ponderosae]|uniref:Large ribosomal subunit protein bL34m n=1 Tax=Dendroctonus ponderosae TaxID=77166 RepID=A0AAR5PRQ0_DENPD|nr:hypothetical protein HUJ04_001209 [Dendroctonus ponderosae]